MSKAIDHTGVRYGKIVGVSQTNKKKGSQIVWQWRCDCGEVFESVAGNFVHRNTGSCGKCSLINKRAASKVSNTTHGMTKTKEYKSWIKIRERCLHENCEGYANYGGAGITIFEEWEKSFLAFLSHIGKMPSDGKRYTCDRIDNNKGYIPGNVRWATGAQQARNRGSFSNNTSGHTGVSVCNKIHPNGVSSTVYAVAQWRDMEGKPQRKGFSFKKYGEELALLCAIEARDQAIRLLNQQGAGYSPNHGK